MHLKEGVGGDAQLQAGELLPDPAPARQYPGLRTHQQVVGQGLEIEGHPHQIGPAGHPVLRQGLEALQVGAAAHQGDQSLAAAAAHPQGQMPQATAMAVAIHRPGAGLEILLERKDQVIDAGIEHRAAVHVHDLMGTAAVVARPQPSIRIALQGDHGAVAVAEARGGGQQGGDTRLQPGDASQVLLHLLLFPGLLGGVFQGLESAATAMVGQDAGRAAAIDRGGLHGQQFGHQVSATAGDDPCPHPVSGQTACHEHHLSLQTADPPAITGEILKIQAHPLPYQGHPPLRTSLDPIDQRAPACCKGALHVGGRPGVPGFGSIGSARVWSLQ